MNEITTDFDLDCRAFSRLLTFFEQYKIDALAGR